LLFLERIRKDFYDYIFIVVFGGGVFLFYAAFSAFINNFYAFFTLLRAYGLKYSAAITLTVTGIYVHMNRTKALFAMVACGIAQRRNFRATDNTIKRLVYNGEKGRFQHKYFHNLRNIVECRNTAI